MVFDNGQTKELDHLPAQSFQIGGNCVPFVSNSGQFKVYYNGEVITLADQFVSRYFTSSYLLVYFVYDQLYVFDNGQSKLLSSHVTDFAAGDSIVAFFNENTHCSQVYYKGEVIDLERSLVGSPVREYRTGDNLFAYFNDNTNYLKVFYQGKIRNILQSASNVEYQPGRNILAYIDKGRNSFHLFYCGQIFDLEDYYPKSFKVGDDMLAYIDNLGTFKVFYNGETQIVSNFEPDFYELTDSLLVYSEQGYLNVFYKGEIHELGNFIPEEYQMQESTLAYIGPNGWLLAFTNGRLNRVTSDLINSFTLSYNLICINTTIDKVKIFYKGKLHDTH